jgi:transposase
MGTSKNRGRYDRSALRYPSDLTDDEWALIEPLIPPARRGGNKRHVDEREGMNGDHVCFEHGMPVSIRMALMRASRSKARSATFL